jgi:hypothetical protein
MAGLEPVIQARRLRGDRGNVCAPHNYMFWLCFSEEDCAVTVRRLDGRVNPRIKSGDGHDTDLYDTRQQGRIRV